MNEFTQVNTDELTRTDWPVIVVGGGPAGAVCALSLARDGHEVLVLDKYHFPRHKTCGDQLLPHTLNYLEMLGLRELVRQEAISLRGLRVYSPSNLDFLVPGEFLGIRRHDFDDILMRTAMEAGVTFALGRVTAVQPQTGGEATVTVAGLSRPLKAGIVVLATGASVSLADKIGMIERRLPSAVAVRFYVESSYELTEGVLSYDRALLPGYAWIFPVARDLFNIGCGLRLIEGGGGPEQLRPMLDRFLRESPIGSRIVERRWYATKIRGAPLRCGLSGTRSMVRDNVVCVGEVVGTTFPFTGEGIGQAIRTGLMAAEVIDETLKSGDLRHLGDYETRIEQEVRPVYRSYLEAEKWLSRPWLADRLAARFRRSRYLQEALASFVDGTSDPGRIFSIASLLKSYVR